MKATTTPMRTPRPVFQATERTSTVVSATWSTVCWTSLVEESLGVGVAPSAARIPAAVPLVVMTWVSAVRGSEAKDMAPG